MARTLPVVQPGDPSLTPGTSIDVVDEWVGAVGRATAPHGSRVHPGGHGRVTFPEGYDQAAIDQLLLEVTMSPASRWDVLVMASDAPPGGHHILLVHGRSRGLDISVVIEPDGRGILDGWPTIPPGVVPEGTGLSRLMRRFWGAPLEDSEPEFVGLDEVLLSGELRTAQSLLMCLHHGLLSPADVHVIDAMCRRLDLDDELDLLLSRPHALR